MKSLSPWRANPEGVRDAPAFIKTAVIRQSYLISPLDTDSGWSWRVHDYVSRKLLARHAVASRDAIALGESRLRRRECALLALSEVEWASSRRFKKVSKEENEENQEPGP
jgi:hypothetical protein